MKTEILAWLINATVATSLVGMAQHISALPCAFAAYMAMSALRTRMHP